MIEWFTIEVRNIRIISWNVTGGGCRMLVGRGDPREQPA